MGEGLVAQENEKPASWMPGGMVSGPALCVCPVPGATTTQAVGTSISRRNERLCWTLAHCWHLSFHALSSLPVQSMAASGLRPTQAGEEAPKQQ